MERQPDESIGEFTRRGMRELWGHQRVQSATPVDVAADVSDADLDDHLWLRISGRVCSASADEVRQLHDDVRAYYVTRLFEWTNGFDGPLAFMEQYGELVQFVADAYRHLGLSQAAGAFERFVASGVVQSALVRRGAPSEEGLRVAEQLVEAVGWHDEERMRFVRAHPGSFDA